MKKHKSVVAILLAVMMIFTMMPMMSFAANVGDGTWNYPDYTSVSVTSGGVATAYTNVKKTWNPSNGMVTAALDWDNTSASGRGPEESVDYWDFSKAAIKAFENYTYGDFTTAFTANADYSEYTMNVPTLLISKPDNAAYPTGVTTANPAEVTALGCGTIEVTATGFDKDSFADQTVTLKAKISASGNTAAEKAANQQKLVNATAVATKTIKVLKRNGTKTDVNVSIDDLTTGSAVVKAGVAQANATALYTGAEHTFVANEVPGLTVSYKQFNAEKNAFEDVTAISAKDAGSYDAIVIIKDAKGVQLDSISVSFKIAKADAPTFMFDDDPAPCGYEDYPYLCDYAVAEGETYDPMDFIIVKPAVTDPTVKAVDAANKKAVAANQKELLAYFKDYVAFATATKKSAPNVEEVTYALNEELTPAQKKELKEKYKALVNNFDFAADGASIVSITNDKVKVYTAATPADYEVTFTKAITKKTYKAKKNKLPKNKTITVKAEAANGADVAYKLVNVETAKIKIDKATGKITLKKGLKKGTYKIKVKAYIPGYPAEMGAFEFQTITVKIKK